MTFKQACNKARATAINRKCEMFVFVEDLAYDEYGIGSEFDADTFYACQEPVAGFWPDGDAMDY